MSKLVVTALSLAVLSTLAGCSGGDEGEGEESSASAPRETTSAAASTEVGDVCEAYCGRLSECDTSADKDTCLARCERSTRSFSMYRSDVVANLAQCFRASDCRQALDTQRITACADEATLSVTPGEDVKAFCDAWEVSARKCDRTFPRAKCLVGFAPYASETLERATACTQKSCAQSTTCLEAVFDF